MCRRSGRGFTLLEVIVAILLFALTAAGVTGALSNGLMTIRSARDLNVAQAILQQELALVRAAPPGQLRPQEDGPFIGQPELLADLKAHGTLTVRELPQTNLLEVTATVSWQEAAPSAGKPPIENRMQLATVVRKEQ